MQINEELGLLIKSKYPVVYFETVDETYALKQLQTLSNQLNFTFYKWSLTGGLKRGSNQGFFYQTTKPIKMLHQIQEILKDSDNQNQRPGLFVLKDFEKHLDDALTERIFKDTVNKLKKTKDTIVILSAEYKIPKDIKANSAHFVGGYPCSQEIQLIIKEIIEEEKTLNKKADLTLDDTKLSKISTSLKGLTAQQIRNVINQFLLLKTKDLSILETYKKKIFDKEGLLEFHLTENKENIAGFENVKRWIAERKNSFSLNKANILPVPKGILLMGVQGCGKSLAVKAIAKELNLSLYSLDLGRLYSKYIGETEQNLRKALSVVEKLCPVCLWIDEIEKGFSASSGDGDGGVSQRMLGSFLTWMQERKKNCFIAATANDVSRLPPEFLRKGRFDEIFFVDLPHKKSRKKLLEIHLKKRELNPKNFNLEKITLSTIGFSGAEIEQAIIAALYRASTEESKISTNHILEQIKSTKPLSILKKEEIFALRNWAKERTIPS